MRRLDRSGVEPPPKWEETIAKALPDPEAFYRQAERFEDLDVSSEERRDGFAKFAPEVLPEKKGRPCFPSKWGQAKDALAEMSHGKCAYCEAPINARRSGQVEHFRPKSLFPTLAYDWNNYFLGCAGCNGAKSDKWPRRGGYLRPDEGDPPRHLEFTADGKVSANRQRSAAARTVEDFKLNRAWLVHPRKTAIGVVLEDLENLVRGCPGSTARGLIRGKYRRLAGNPRHAYSVALMQCLRRVWRDAFPGERL